MVGVSDSVVMVFVKLIFVHKNMYQNIALDGGSHHIMYVSIAAWM